MRYPQARRLDLVEELFGHQVADPYRWLEAHDDPDTRAWSEAQDALVREHLDALPGRDRLRGRIGALLRSGSV
ncbi:MAG TPA: S9 family peptidase, partial [Frankiaceae bacterium]|nr:S9 family peptidase [Frankiaceae bacterium]